MVWGARGFNSTNAGHFVPVVPSPGQTPCREQLKPQCPILEPWSGRESSRGAPQPPSDRESLWWELRLEQAPRQDRHQRGEKEGEAELRGFAGGCAKEPLEQPYGRRQCRAPPASAAPRDRRSGFFSAARQWSRWGGHRAPPLPSPRSAAAPGAAEPRRGVGRGQGGLGSRRGGEKGAEGSSSPAELRTPQPSPAAPREQARHPWAQNRALGCTTVIKCGS